MNTRLAFRKFPEGDIIAIFPYDNYGKAGLVNSYQHVGQHGAASLSLLDELEQCSPDEYKSLYDELESIGYHDLRILERV